MFAHIGPTMPTMPTTARSAPAPLPLRALLRSVTSVRCHISPTPLRRQMSALNPTPIPRIVPCTDAIFDAAGATTGPGGGTLEYDLDPTPSIPRLAFSPDLFLRSLLYLGTYSSAAYSFATPHLSIALPPSPASLTPVPSSLLDAITPWLPDNTHPGSPSLSLRVEANVWRHEGKATLNVVSHPWAFDPAGPEESNFTYRAKGGGTRDGSDGKNGKKKKGKRKRQIIALGLFAPDGVSSAEARRPVSMGKMGPIEVSMHSKRGGMACSPNNAQLEIADSALDRGFASFWLAAVLVDRILISYNILLLTDDIHSPFLDTVLATNNNGGETPLPDFLAAIADASPALDPIASSLASFVAEPSLERIEEYHQEAASREATASTVERKDVTHEWITNGEGGSFGKGPNNAKGSKGGKGEGRGSSSGRGGRGSSSGANGNEFTANCVLCGETKPVGSFSKSQRRKPFDIRKCMQCIAAQS